MGFPVNLPGFAADGSTAEILLSGQPLPVAMEDVKWGQKVIREMLYLLGERKPQERTGGHLEYTFSCTMPMRQLILLAQSVSTSEDPADLASSLTLHEFTQSINVRPKRDPNMYVFNLKRLTFDDLEFSLDVKSAAKVPVTGTFMDMEMLVKSQ